MENNVTPNPNNKHVPAYVPDLVTCTFVIFEFMNWLATCIPAFTPGFIRGWTD